MDEKLNQWNSHCILYSKGWYVESNKTLGDLQTIAKKVGLPAEPEQVLKYLADLSFQAILQAGNDTSWEQEFTNFCVFMYRNRGEIREKYAPTLLDGDVDKKNMHMLEEQLVRGLLVQIAKMYVEEELPEPNKAILMVKNPSFKKEKQK